MRFLHISDLHLGKSLNGYSLIEDQRHALSQILTMLDEHNVNAIALAGDLYDKSTPSAESVALLDWFLSCIAQRGVTCFAIPGNHDSAERVAYGARILSHQGIHCCELFTGTMMSCTLEDEWGPVTFWMLPFVKPAHVRPFFSERSIEQDYTEAIRAVIESANINTAQRNIILSHQFVTAGSQSPELSDSELSVGGMDNVDASVFDDFDYVALGHIHRPQRIGRDTVRYAGSLLKYSLSEANYPKSAVLVDIGEKVDVSECDINFTLLPIVPMRDVRRIKGPLSELIKPENVQLENADDYVSAVLTDEQPVIDALARLRAAYPNILGLEYESKTSGANQPSITLPQANNINPLELFEQFYREQNGVDLSESQVETARTALSKAIEGDAE